MFPARDELSAADVVRVGRTAASYSRSRISDRSSMDGAIAAVLSSLRRRWRLERV